MFGEIIIAALAIMAVSLIGILFVQKTAGAWLESRLHRLVSFAAGVFAVTATLLILEVFHVVESFFVGSALIFIGYGAAWATHYLIPESHHHHGGSCGHSAKKLLIGDAIHNIGDGIILVPAFMVSSALGWTVAASIIIHEAVQEISEFFVLRRAGYSVKKALLINGLVSSTILIGVLIGALALVNSNLEGVLLAVTAGFFLHVVIHDLLPLERGSAKATYISHGVLILLGALLMFGITNALGDTHVHGTHEDEHPEHEEESAHHTDGETEHLHSTEPEHADIHTKEHAYETETH
jgi:zinc transporter ZupT